MESENPHQAALLLIDVINDFDFDGADKMLAQMTPVVQKIQTLCADARAVHIPVIYVNDNFGLWRSERSDIVKYCMRENNPGRAVVASLAPQDEDYFIIKPRHSGFFASGLPVLLPDLFARRLIIVGVAADICVLFTANDAYMRDYTLWIPSDCVASSEAVRTERAIEHMGKILKAETRATSELKIATWLRNSKVPERFTGETSRK